MGQHRLLNYPSGPEIKEMVERERITIEELDIRALDLLFEYESARVCAGKNDDALLLKIAKLLSPTNPTDDVKQKYRDLIHKTLKSRTVNNTSVS